MEKSRIGVWYVVLICLQQAIMLQKYHERFRTALVEFEAVSYFHNAFPVL